MVGRALVRRSFAECAFGARIWRYDPLVLARWISRLKSPPGLNIAGDFGSVMGSCSFSNRTTEEGEFRVTMLDVGRGLAMVVATHAHVLVYDFGPRLAVSVWARRWCSLIFTARATVSSTPQSSAMARMIIRGASSVLCRFPEKLLPEKPEPTASIAICRPCSLVWDGVTFHF